MAPSPQPISLKARYVFPVAGEPIAGGMVTIVGERLVAVEPYRQGTPAIDLGDVALIPGLVNAHTHLEFSGLAEPLAADERASFASWLKAVVASRRAAPPITGDRADPIAKGLAEALATGTTTLGEISTAPWRAFEQPPGGIVFREMIAPTAELMAVRGQNASEHVAEFAANTETSLWRPGLSPHAPYTVGTETLAEIVELACQRQVPLAMHLAESREELEFLATRGGPLREMLEAAQQWDGSLESGPRRALGYLQQLAAAPRALAIHGNYLTADEIDFLAEHRERMAVVYCPRTHAYFGHDPHPLPTLLAHGAAVALGTDSRASNPDLDLLAEMRQVLAAHPDVSPRRVLELGTLSGAEALGLADQCGSLLPGKLANLAVVELGSDSGGAVDPHELLFSESNHVFGTWWRGKQCGLSR